MKMKGGTPGWGEASNYLRKSTADAVDVVDK